MKKDKKTIHAGIDTAAIRAAAKNFADGAVTAGYEADRKKIVAMLNNALATELVRILRYKRHYYTATGLKNGPIKAGFLQHANSCALRGGFNLFSREQIANCQHTRCGRCKSEGFRQHVAE